MLIARIFSLIFFALTLMALGADLLFWLETSAFTPHSLSEMLAIFSGTPAESIQAWAMALPGVASAPLRLILSTWAFAVLGLPGILLALAIGRQRRT